MKRKILSLLTALCLCLCLTAVLTDTAHAGDLDLIRQYNITVTPNAEDGSLHIRLDFEWEVLEQGPVEWLQIGIPNGSIREVEILSDNIASLDFDNSFMYVYFDRGYDDGEVFTFSYAWTQEYMYTLGGDGSVTYDYTPGWFDGANIQCMTLIWNTPAELGIPTISHSATDGQWADYSADNGFPLYEGRGLGHGAQLNVTAQYGSWPAELLWEMSSENLPDDSWQGDYDYNDDYYYDDDGDEFLGILFIVMLVVIWILIRAAAASDGYAGGFGTRYVLYHGLWYPAGRDGKPRPGSVGTKKKPSPPRSSGGFGGGSRGGGFGGGGFGGGGHCACASSCACACACACAGGGRAGCSAKNLYGSVQLSRQLTEKLTEE